MRSSSTWMSGKRARIAVAYAQCVVARRRAREAGLGQHEAAGTDTGNAPGLLRRALQEGALLWLDTTPSGSPTPQTTQVSMAVAAGGGVHAHAQGRHDLAPATE
jgi:hypothetical protein